MALDETEQIRQVIRQSHHILITFKKDYSVDAVASALALYLILKKQDKLVDIACDGFVLPENLKFLPDSAEIADQISNLQRFVISLDISENKIDNLSYDHQGNELKIYITPKSGSFKQENVKADNSGYKYDLIIAVDTPDLDSLGSMYNDFNDFFYNTSIINIDHKPENEHFGQINLTNLNAVATAEILFELINELNKNLLDKDVATCLLTGMISKTRSFKTASVTPRTLHIASQLLAADADREKIIKNLYRSRSLSTLNLWGRVLYRLKNDKNNKLVWSWITEHDFVEAGSGKNDLPDVIEELISFVPGVEVVVLIYQLGGKNYVLINATKNHNALYLASSFNPTGSKTLAEFCLAEMTLPEAEKTVIDKVKERLGEK